MTSSSRRKRLWAIYTILLAVWVGLLMLLGAQVFKPTARTSSIGAERRTSLTSRRVTLEFCVTRSTTLPAIRPMDMSEASAKNSFTEVCWPLASR